MKCMVNQFFCDNRCHAYARWCDGVTDCQDGADEVDCERTINNQPQTDGGERGVSGRQLLSAADGMMSYEPSSDVAMSIVLPTIVGCVVLVAAMLVGIRKCKQWEFDRIMEMRRTRKVIQRLTARLREKNFRTLQKAREMRKRTMMQQQRGVAVTTTPVAADTPLLPRSTETPAPPPPPPIYDAEFPFQSGNSPPPPYEDALFDQYYYELVPTPARNSSRRRRRRRSDQSATSSGGGVRRRNRAGRQEDGWGWSSVKHLFDD